MDFRVGVWCVRREANTVEAEGTVRRLTPKAMDVLVCLARRNGDVVSKADLFKEVWPDTCVSDDALTRSIGELRRALNDMARHPTVIETIARRGYRIIAPISWNGATSEPSSPPVSDVPPQTPSVLDDTRAVGRRAPLLPRHLKRIAVIGVVIAVGVAAAVSAVWLGERPSERAALVVHRLAVLPFQTESGGGEQDYFTEGMTRSVIAELTKLGSLQVVFRSSTDQYKGVRTLLDVAREAGADAILRGSVLHVGPRVRLTAQIAPIGGDHPVWSGSFERDMDHVQSLEWEMAHAVATQVGAVTSGDGRLLRRAEEVAPDAYEEFLRGYYFLDRMQYAAATEHFSESVKRDPRFALAWALLYEADSMTSYGRDQPFSDRALGALERARALDAGLSEVHTGLGDVKFVARDWAAGEAEYRRAVEIDPTSLDAARHYVLCLHLLGRKDEAIREARRALRMDPVCLVISVELTGLLRNCYRYGEALEQFRRSIEIDPASSSAYRMAAAIYEAQGRHAEAMEAQLTSDRLSDLSPDSMRALEAAAAYGERTYWKKKLELASAGPLAPGPERLAEMHLNAGDREGALALLLKAERAGSARLMWLNSVAAWDPLRSDPRFQALVQRLNLPR